MSHAAAAAPEPVEGFELGASERAGASGESAQSGAAGSPAVPEDVDASDLDREVRAELRSLPKPRAEAVARHLVAAGRLLDDDPGQALAHALAARRLATRIAAVREAVGIAAYHAGEWQMASSELRTYHRISGRLTHLAVVADCERALGRPERAVDLQRTADRSLLAPSEAIELLIVASGARRDLGQHESAVAMLQVPQLSAAEPDGAAAPPWSARLRYAYADALLDAGRPADAREWFARAAVADQDSVTDAAERLLELDGVMLEETPEEPTAEETIDQTPEQTSTPEPVLTQEPEPEPAPALTQEPEPEPEPESAPAVAAIPRKAEPAEEADEAEPAAEAGEPARPEPLIQAYDLVILDLDGVVYLGEEAIPSAIEAIARLRREGPPIVYATNNASRSPAEIASLLTRLGVAATATEVLTSAAVAADTLAERLDPGEAVLVIGTESLADEIRRVGLRPVRSADAQPRAVVQGYGPQVGWADLAEAYLAIRAGAQWVATNTDATLPSARGLLPGNGSLVAALRTALEREPDLVVGKPQPAIFTAAARRAGARAPLVVGDRLDTDIQGANRAGMNSLLVLTGVGDRDQVRAAAPPERPTYLGDDLTALFAPGVQPLGGPAPAAGPGPATTAVSAT